MYGSENAERALEYAAYMAKRCESELLFIIHVIEEFGRNIRTLEKHDSVVKARSQAFTTVKVMRAAGNAGEEILRAAEKEEAGMTVVDRRGLSTASELLLEAYQTI
jgi:nucleotide-binding universal stress UspA family protein